MAATSPEAKARKRANDAEKRRIRARNLRANNTEYAQRDKERRAIAHKSDWSLGTAVIATVDGEDAHDDGNYSQLGIETPSGQRSITAPPGHSITFQQFAQHILRVKRQLKREYKGRRIYLISYYFQYDAHSCILHDANITPQQKWAIRERMSKKYGAIRSANYDPVVILPQYGLGVEIQPKSVQIYYYKREKDGTIALDDNGKPVIYNRVKIDDIGTTFAMRFDLAVKLFRSEVPAEELEQFDTELALITRGKDARGDFKSAGMSEADIELYNHYEGVRCNWMAGLMIKLCKELGLRPRSLAGPAPLARALFDKYGLQPHIKREDYDTVEYQEGEAMGWHRDSFHAGWIEQTFIGYVPEWWEVDTVNAYVEAERNAPCAAHAIERPLTAAELEDVNIHHIVHDGWEYEIVYKCEKWRPFGPFAHRHRAGTMYPLKGRERIFGVQLRAFFDTLGNDEYDVVAGYAHESTCEIAYPFAEMTTTTYESRKIHKAEGRKGLSEIEKKALLSGYGVTAQTAGGYRVVDKDGKTIEYHTPRYSNLWLAGFITAYERARQMRYNRTYNRNIIGHATDAAFMLTLPPEIAAKESNELGGIEIKQHGPTFFYGAGMRSGLTKDESKRRGFTVHIPIEELMEVYRNGGGVITIQYRHFKGLPESVHNSGGVITIDENAGHFVVAEKKVTVGIEALKSKRDISRVEHVVKDDGTDYLYAPPPPRPTGTPLRYQRPYDKPSENILEIAVRLAERNMEKYQP